MKITLITACYNSAGTIRTAMESVLRQNGVDVEYIVVDGASTDGTVEILKEFEKKLLNLSTVQPFNFRWLLEKDRGMYDAINKGIKMATGDVVGILNADDVLATDDTLAKIAAQFEGRGKGKREEKRSIASMLTYALCGKEIRSRRCELRRRCGTAWLSGGVRGCSGLPRWCRIRHSM